MTGTGVTATEATRAGGDGDATAGVGGVGAPTPLTVWAPSAETVELVDPATDGRTAMRPEPGGWWSCPALPHGTDYGFSVDGGPLRPDPRSPWQPHGVHSASRWFDTSTLHWSDQGWQGLSAAGAVHLELHVGTFTPEGSFAAAADRLQHLADLGVQMVELMPVASSNGDRGWGYDGVSLYSVHEPYGGPAGLAAFVDAAHRHGIGVCLDVVHNHLGASGNYLATFGPYFSTEHHTPWGAAINLDGEGSEVVREWVIGSVERWFRDFHVDALRLDAVHALIDDSPVHLLAELSDRVAALSAAAGRPLSLVAESDANDPRTVVPTASGGLGLTGQWADDVHHAIHALLTGERHGYYVDFGSVAVLAKAMRSVFVHDGATSTFRGQPWGAPVPDDVDGHRFVVTTQNHDQVGNRAMGDRPSERLDADHLAASLALLLCSPFTPMLFQGEEWGSTTPFRYFTSHPEADLAAAVTAGRLAEFSGHDWSSLYPDGIEVPDPQDPATFETSVLDWAEAGLAPHTMLLGWTRRLVALRSSSADLRSGDRRRTAVLVAEADGRLVSVAPAATIGPIPADGPFTGVIGLRRGRTVVVANLTTQQHTLRLDPAPASPHGLTHLVLLAAWKDADFWHDQHDATISLAPGACVVVEEHELEQENNHE